MGVELVFVDANVLFSKTLRDWLALLQSSSQGELFKVQWTEDVMAEVIYSLRRQRPDLPGDVVSDLRRKVERTFSGGRVDSYEIDPEFKGRDPDDAHIHSAAIACGASILLTCNAKDFEVEEADHLPYEIYTPDDFFLLVDDSSPEVVREVIETQLRYWITKKGEADLVDALRRAGTPDFAGRVRQHLQTIDISKLPIRSPVDSRLMR